MATAEAAPGTFGAKLRAEFDSRSGFGARTLAKLIVQERGGSIDNHRRSIIRWLQGATPNLENRHLIEDVLGIPRDSLKGDDEDEEEALFYQSLNDVLRLGIRLAVEREVKRVLA